MAQPGRRPAALLISSFSLLDEDGRRSTGRPGGWASATSAWQACEGAPAQADPWICVINGRSVFLQGVNFPPVRPNFADVREADYRQRLELYRELGVNAFRINACGFLETECFLQSMR